MKVDLASSYRFLGHQSDLDCPSAISARVSPRLVPSLVLALAPEERVCHQMK